jgi:hypothetical protein
VQSVSVGEEASKPPGPIRVEPWNRNPVSSHPEENRNRLARARARTTAWRARARTVTRLVRIRLRPPLSLTRAAGVTSAAGPPLRLRLRRTWVATQLRERRSTLHTDAVASNFSAATRRRAASTRP